MAGAAARTRLGGEARPGEARPGGGARPGAVRLTGRGALLAMFVLFFLGLLASGWLGWGPLTGGTFVAATALAAARTQRGDLLAVTVSPPALFGGAVVCVKALTASGNVLLSAGAGTLITLANTAPWLLAGTALSLVIAFGRGLRGTAAALGRELHGLPPPLTARRLPPGGLHNKRLVSREDSDVQPTSEKRALRVHTTELSETRS